jgi:hypothetical protein
MHVFLISALVGDGGQLHAPAALPPGKETPVTHWLGGWVGTRADMDDVEKRIFFTLPVLELQPLSRPARSQSLYRLGKGTRNLKMDWYLGSMTHFWRQKFIESTMRQWSWILNLRILKETAQAYFKTLSQHSSGETDEEHEILFSIAINPPEIWTGWTPNISIERYVSHTPMFLVWKLVSGKQRNCGLDLTSQGQSPMARFS